MKIKLTLYILLSIFLSCEDGIAVELKEGRALRDAEIERTLKSYITPIFKVAGLNPEKLNLVIVYDNSVNASAALDNTLIVNTGLIQLADSAGEVIGVLAHETAHIADGHVVRTETNLENAQTQSLIGTLLGAVVGIAAQKTDLGMGVIIANQEMVKGMFLKHSRVQEGAADHGALRYLDKLGWSSQGLKNFMQKMIQFDPRSSLDEVYQSTHPLTKERVSAFNHHLSKGLGKGGAIPPEMEKDFQRMKAKIDAHVLPIHQLELKYVGDSPLDRYVHTVSALRVSDFALALDRIEALLETYPKDPDYWDLKGQILFESGNPKKAVEAYGRAVQLDPLSPLLRALWSQSMIESGDSSLLPKAENTLLRIVQEDPYRPFYWHLLAVAYGRQDKIGFAALALAEQNLLEGNFQNAKGQATRSLSYFDDNSPQHMRAQDIKNEVARLMSRAR